MGKNESNTFFKGYDIHHFIDRYTHTHTYIHRYRFPLKGSHRPEKTIKMIDLKNPQKWEMNILNYLKPHDSAVGHPIATLTQFVLLIYPPRAFLKNEFVLTFWTRGFMYPIIFPSSHLLLENTDEIYGPPLPGPINFKSCICLITLVPAPPFPSYLYFPLCLIIPMHFGCIVSCFYRALL